MCVRFQLLLSGGAWDAKLDGADPEKLPTLKKTAVRILKTLYGVDLSSCKFHRFLDLKYVSEEGEQVWQLSCTSAVRFFFVCRCLRGAVKTQRGTRIPKVKKRWGSTPPSPGPIPFFCHTSVNTDF